MADLTFNFVGVNAVDFQRAFGFYTETLGVTPAEPTPPDEPESWAMLVAGWDDSPISDARGLRCELFEKAGDPPDERRWGHGQNVRPSIQVADLEAVRTELENRGVPFTGDIAETPWGQSTEFRAPEGVRWSLSHDPGAPAGPSLETPYLGRAEQRVTDLEAHVGFYTGVMGLHVGERSGTRVRLEQGEGEPALFLESGGEHLSGHDGEISSSGRQPVWMSFETDDVAGVASRFRDQGVPLLREIRTHEWGGRDVPLEDPDGNRIQIVEYVDE